MFLDSVEEMTKVATRAGAVVFVVGAEYEVETTGRKRKGEVINLPGAIVVEPEDGKKITVAQIREVIGMVRNQQKKDQFFVFKQAELLREEAENAMLKLLEEPKEGYHFILMTDKPEMLLATILSRVEVYYLRRKKMIETPPKVKAKVLDLAKRFLATKTPRDYLVLADEIHKKKDERDLALKVLETAIELAYKSYLMTGKQQFLVKVPKLIKAYSSISDNGNVRLHLVADLC